MSSTIGMVFNGLAWAFLIAVYILFIFDVYSFEVAVTTMLLCMSVMVAWLHD